MLGAGETIANIDMCAEGKTSLQAALAAGVGPARIAPPQLERSVSVRKASMSR